VVALAYDAAAIGGAPEGFGFLAPRGEGLRILGCLWDSSIFPGRAPAGKVLVRAMVGGALDREAVDLAEDELVALVRADLARAMGLAAEPERVWVFRHPLGISQYTVGHGARLAAIEGALARLPGLYVVGQSYHGIAMNAAIESAGRPMPPLGLPRERRSTRSAAPAVRHPELPREGAAAARARRALLRHRWRRIHAHPRSRAPPLGGRADGARAAARGRQRVFDQLLRAETLRAVDPARYLGTSASRSRGGGARAAARRDARGAAASRAPSRRCWR
jgi:hypothetical protein